MRCVACCAWLVLAAAAPAHADVEHDHIRQEREEARQRQASRERECLTRFVAAPCLDAARAAQRDTMQRLRRQQLEIDANARREVAEARRRAVEAARERSAARVPPVGAASGAPEPVEPVSDARRSAVAPTRLFPDRSALPRIEGSKSPAVEADRTARFDARGREVEAHREKIRQRNAERAARGPLAAPLPMPDAALSPANPMKRKD